MELSALAGNAHVKAVFSQQVLHPHVPAFL